MVIYGPRQMVDPDSGRKAALAFVAGVNSFPSLTYPLYRSAQVVIRPMDVSDGAHAAGLVAVDRLINTRS